MLAHRAVVALAMLLGVACSSASVQSTPQPTPSGPPPGFTAGAYEGTTSGGAAYKIEAPTNWNGTLLLYSHGYVGPGAANPARDVGDPTTAKYLLERGFALAGTSYSTSGWAVEQAFKDQTDVLDLVAQKVGKPSRTIAWGHSLGGMITAGLVQRNPERFQGALPMCGVLAGGVGVWDMSLDGQFVATTLLAPTASIQLVRIGDPNANVKIAQAMYAEAQKTPAGRARLSLAAAVSGVPGWFSAASPEPSATDFTALQLNQEIWQEQVDAVFVFGLRAELEKRAGGNPSSNVGVDYARQLDASPSRAEVSALYQTAGLNLQEDLGVLARAPRVSADPTAREYLRRFITFDGDLKIPVLTMHTSGDGLVPVEEEHAYGQTVARATRSALLRQLFVHRAGHCAFTPAETVTALGALIKRIDTGTWPDLTPSELASSAKLLGDEYNAILVQGKPAPVPAAFFRFDPAAFPRPFDAYVK